MTLKALQTIIMACDGCLLAYLTLYLPLSLFAPLYTCLSLYLPHCLPVCASACLFVRLGNFTISFLSFLSKVLYRNLLYLPLLLTLLSHTHTRTHVTASEQQQQRQRQGQGQQDSVAYSKYLRHSRFIRFHYFVGGRERQQTEKGEGGRIGWL